MSDIDTTKEMLILIVSFYLDQLDYKYMKKFNILFLIDSLLTALVGVLFFRVFDVKVKLHTYENDVVVYVEIIE